MKATTSGPSVAAIKITQSKGEGVMRGVIVSLVIVAMFSLLPSTAWTTPCCNGDYACNGDVEFSDYILFVSDFMRGFLGIAAIEPCYSVGISKTGQTISYATGDDGDLQKGVGWPNPRFTDNGDGTVTDNLTGLIWLKDANCFGLRTWDDALSDCNELVNGSCSLTDGSRAGDWRLPNYRELFSLINAEAFDPDDIFEPALPIGHPFTNVESFYYWSSTTNAQSNEIAWDVYMPTGSVYYDSKGNIYYVWPVRGGH